MSESPSQYVFVATPMGPGFEQIYEAVRLATLKLRADVLSPIRFMRTAPERSAENLAEAVRHAITASSAVIADVTGANPNVMWEVGIAEALRKPLILLTQDPSQTPFDLRTHPQTVYDRSESVQFLESRIAESLSAILGIAWTGRPTQPIGKPPKGQVFITYSHADTDYLKRILVHLRPLERDGLIDLWTDRNLSAGDEWRAEIKKAVSQARVAILLVSADFLASEFISTDELPPLLAAAENRGTRVLPVIVKPSRFLRDKRLSKFQSVNDPAAPLINLPEGDREEVYAKIAELVELDLQP